METQQAKLRGRMTLAIVAGFLSLVVLDLGARLVFDQWTLIRPTPIYKNRWPVDPRVSRFTADVQFDAEIVGGLALMDPGSPAVPRRMAFVTDVNGFRNRPDALDRANDLVLLGDSFGAGSGTTQDETLSAALERHFGIPNYNISVGGHGPWQEYMTLRYAYNEIPKSRDATIVWLLYAGNDLGDHYFDDLTVHPRGWFDRFAVRAGTFLKRSPVWQSIERLMLGSKSRRKGKVRVISDAGHSMSFFEPNLANLGRTEAGVRSHANAKKFSGVFDAMSRFAKTKGHRLIVVLAPTKAQVYEGLVRGDARLIKPGDESAFSRVIRALATSNAVDYVDLLPALKERAEVLRQEGRGYVYWRDDMHWNVEGQLAAAASIADVYRMPAAVGR